MKDLYNIAKENLKNAYTPYSNFRVSAVLKLKDGRTFKGINVENASYGLSNCAERSALFSAFSQGVKKEEIAAILILTEKDYFISPCGACRQVMSELMEPEAKVYFANIQGEIKELKNKELLPYGFSGADL